MTAITVERKIDAPLEKVWEVFIDIPASADRIDGIESVELLTGREIGEGTRWRETRKIYGRPSSEEMEITEFEPMKSYTAEAESHGSHYTSVFSFEADGSGTKVTLTFGAEALTPVAKLAAAVAKPFGNAVAKMLEADLEDLQRFLES